MKTRQSLLMLLSVAIISIFSSCKKDVDLNNIDTQMEADLALAIPIGTATATLGDLLQVGQLDQYFYITDDTLMYLRKDTIRPDFHPIDLSQYISETTQSISLANSLPSELLPIIELLGSAPLPAGTSLPIDLSMGIHLEGINNNTVNERIDSARIDSACFTTVITQTGMENFAFSDIQKLTMYLPTSTFLLYGQTPVDGYYAVDIPLQGQDWGTEIPIYIRNFTLNLYNTGGNVANNMTIDFHFDITTTSDVTIQSTASLMYNMKVQFIDYSVLYGFFQPDDLLNDTNTISLLGSFSNWENFEKLTLPVANPRIELSAWTTVGAPIIFQFDKIYSYSNENPSDRRIASGNDNQWRIDFPKSSDPLGTIVYSHKTFDNTNAGLAQLFTIRPDIIGYEYRAFIDRNQYNIQHRLEKDTRINIETNIVIPFRFNQGVEIAYVDTIDSINIGKIAVDSLVSNIKQIDSLEIRKLNITLNTESWIPFNVIADIDFRDKDGNRVNILLEESQIAENQDTMQIKVRIPGPVSKEHFTDQEGHLSTGITNPKDTTFVWQVNESDLDKLSKVDHAYLRLYVGDNTVTCYAWANSRLELTLGAAADVRVLGDPLKKENKENNKKEE